MYDIVAFTGAGISKASNVPTFQELGDIRNKLSRQFFNSNTKEFYELLLYMKKITDSALPNPAHIALAKYNVPVITMNIDCLHKRAGSTNLIEIHGNLEYVFCPKCNKKFDFETVRESVYCNKCNEVLQPNVVLYGDSIPRYFDAINLIGLAKELLVVGTSFYTSTASFMVDRAEAAGIKVKIINENAENEVPSYLEKVLGKSEK